jgi:hypothetical protein
MTAADDIATFGRLFVVEERDGLYFVRGLQSTLSDEDQVLLVRYDEGDWDSPRTAPLMLSALYDLFQCDDRLKEGDSFITPHGRFSCVGVHVVPADEHTRNEIKRIERGSGMQRRLETEEGY